MHEFGLCASILDAVERRAAGRSVNGVKVRIGTLLQVDFPAFDQAFSLVRQGSVADGAELELVVVPAELSCNGCGTSTISDELLLMCPGCGGSDLRVVAGEDLVLESITVAEGSNADVSGHSR